MTADEGLLFEPVRETDDEWDRPVLALRTAWLAGTVLAIGGVLVEPPIGVRPNISSIVRSRL